MTNPLFPKAEIDAAAQKIVEHVAVLLEGRDSRIAELEAKLKRAREGLEDAATKISGGLCYFTAEAKHQQLLDAAASIEATLRRIDQ